MSKCIRLFYLLIFTSFLKAQTPLTFTIHTISSSSDITCLTPAVRFVASTTYPQGVLYAWTGTSASFSGPSVSITVPGTYTVKASVGSLQSAVQFITVGINTITPVVSLSPSVQSIGCANSITTSIHASSTTTNTSHHFISPFGCTAEQEGVMATYNAGGPGTYTHVAININNGCSTLNTFTVNTASTFPSFSLSSTGGYSLGCGTKSMVTLNLINVLPASPGGGLSYTLANSASSGTSISGALSINPSFNINSFGNYVLVISDDVTSCETRAPFTITENNSPPHITLVAPSRTLNCSWPTLKLSAYSSDPNNSFSWSFPSSPVTHVGNSLMVNTNPSLPLNELLGNYLVNCTDNNNLCSADTSVQVFQNLYKPTALISSLRPNNVNCKYPSLEMINLSSSSIPFNSVFSSTLPVRAFLWTGAPAQSPGVNVPSYFASTPGIYTMQVVDDNNGCMATDTMVVFNGKVYPVVNNPSGPPPFCINSNNTSVAIYAMVSGPATTYTYQWTAPAHATINGVNSPTLVANALGIYTIAVTNTVSGCNTYGQIIIANCKPTGISETNAGEKPVSIYPNPSQGEFIIALNEPGQKNQLKVYNAVGKLMLEEELVSEKNILNFNEMPNGIYMAYIIGDGIVLDRIKLIKN